MRNNKQKFSIKPYLLGVVLWGIFLLVVYEERLPDVSLRIIETAESAYQSLELLFQQEPPVSRTVDEETGFETVVVPISADFDGTKRILRILNPQAATILNPHLSSATRNWEPSRIIYEPLASFDKNGELIPVLAAEIPSLENGGVASDGKSVTWKLKQNLRWSDGEPFSADDVLFTFQFISNPEVNAASYSLYDVVEWVEVVDLSTVTIHFTDVNPAWYLPFVGIQGVILPRHVFEDYNGPNAQDAPANTFPIGTGPYRPLAPGIKLQEVLLLGTQVVETNKIVFEPNPYFREVDSLFFRQIEFRGGGIPEEAARLVLEDGGVDYAYYLGQLTPEQLLQFENGEKGTLITNFGTRVDRILINRTDPNRQTEEGERSSLKYPHPFFREKKVRQAFAHAINREAIAALYGPTGKPTYQNLVAPPQFRSSRIFYEYNLEKARTLLDEAGWIDHDGDGIRDKNGIEMKVVFQVKVSKILQQTQEIIQKDLQQIGVEMVRKIVDPSIMFSSCAEHPDADTCFNADMMEFAFRSPNPDPSAYMQYWTCSQIPQKSNNWSGLNEERWCNEQYDQLYQQVIRELDPDKRRQLFIQMNDLLIEDVVMIPVVYLADVQGVNRHIIGVDLTPWDTNTWNIQDWRRVTP